MIVIVGESGSGKSTLANEFVRLLGYKELVSYTTRSPRAGEVDGKDYHFISEEEFLEKMDAGFFAETDWYRNALYGSAAEDYTENTVAVLTPAGLQKVNHLFGDAVFSVYLNVPRGHRLIRLIKRGDDIDAAYKQTLVDIGAFSDIRKDVSFVLPDLDANKSPERLVKEILAAENVYRAQCDLF